MERNRHHRKRCRRYDIAGHAHELTFSCYGGRAFLKGERALGYLVQAVQEGRMQHNFSVWAYVFMPEHVHLLICPNSEEYSISKILQRIKQPVGRKVIGYCRRYRPTGLKWLETGQNNPTYRFWQDGGGYDRNISKDETLIKIVKYIHENPVRRGLVSKTVDYRWSSARAWEGMETELAIDSRTWPLD